MANTERFPLPLGLSELRVSWTSAWRHVGSIGSTHLLEQLLSAYKQGYRCYHDLRHLGECLALLAAWHADAEAPAEIALALWFHDAVYDPSSVANEMQSAAWAARALIKAGVAAECAQRIYDLVLITQHDSEPLTMDARLLVDIDLAILGSPPERFLEYDRDIRSEYAHVPWGRYREGRRAVLERFVARPRIFSTETATRLFEGQARFNLKSALDRLEQ